MRSSKQRSRSKSNRPRMMGNVTNRVFDSSGPDGKVRGTPQQIIDKYLLLARDAQLSNDRVAAEAFLQHAEHYTRMLGEAQRENDQRRGDGGDWQGSSGDEDQPNVQSGGDGAGDQNGRHQNDRGQNAGNNDRHQGDRGRNDRGRDDRNAGDRQRGQRGPDDRDQRQGNRPADMSERDRGQARQPEADRGGRDAQAARGSFDEVIDLEGPGNDAGLIETPEARAPSDPATGAPDREDRAEAAPAGSPVDIPGAEAAAKPARRRSSGPRRRRSADSDGAADDSAPNNPASAAE